MDVEPAMQGTPWSLRIELCVQYQWMVNTTVCVFDANAQSSVLDASTLGGSCRAVTS